jgi:rRNA maturation RNase YbeY
MRLIQFHSPYPCTLKKRNKLKAFLIEKCVARDIHSIDVHYIFVSDDDLLVINQEHLSHDFYTDIITFDNTLTPGTIMAEIYISVQRVKENAVLFHTTFKNELHRVIFHGLLHLLGYDDSNQELKKLMTAKENEWLRQYEPNL